MIAQVVVQAYVLDCVSLTRNIRTPTLEQQVPYWKLMSNILKTNKRRMSVKEIAMSVARFHPYFAKMTQTNLGCSLRYVLNKRIDLFAKHRSMKGAQFKYSLVGENVEEEKEKEAAADTAAQFGDRRQAALTAAAKSIVAAWTMHRRANYATAAAVQQATRRTTSPHSRRHRAWR